MLGLYTIAYAYLRQLFYFVQKNECVVQRCFLQLFRHSCVMRRPVWQRQRSRQPGLATAE